MRMINEAAWTTHVAMSEFFVRADILSGNKGKRRFR
tara:strand:+ start:929 stop:1036 length:108 start_codon:yes stop_codon:yes gene_type:complete